MLRLPLFFSGSHCENGFQRRAVVRRAAKDGVNEPETAFFGETILNPQAIGLRMQSVVVFNLGARMHILVVDDEHEFLELMNNRLQKRGFTVSVAPTGEKALELVEREKYDAMVLDVKMPGIDGIEVLRQVKKLRPELPVLLLTGHASIEAAMTGVETGAVDYLLKPVPINDLIMRLRDIASRKE